MELKPGYKQTEVGVIPEDWDVYPLSDHFNIFAGGDVPKHSFSEHRTETCPHPIFSNSLREAGLYGFTGEKRAKGDSLTITGRGHLGHAEYRDEEFFPIVRLVALEPRGALDARFTSFSINQTVEFAIESTGVPQLTAPQAGKFLVPAPPINEQRDIARTLADVNVLLASLEAFIQKKKAIKQAAMQELLTGKRRLPGFEGEWEVKRLGDVAPLQRGFDLPNPKLEDGPYPVVYSNGVMNHHAAFQVKGPGVVTGRSGTIGKVHYVANDFWPHNTSLWVTSFRGNDPKFIFYLLSSIGIERFASGSGVPTLNRNDLHDQSIRIPSETREQIAIATALTDLDIDLESSNQQLAKASALKQGMMQQLLTGKIRLK